MPSQSFADLGVSNPVVAALADRGITEPFAVQKLVIADVLAGRDVLAKSPTGSGKTLAFGIPLVERLDANAGRQTALILAPTRELATQISVELREIAHARALSVVAVYGGAGIERQAKLARRAHIIVATPGRLEDLIQRRAISLRGIRVLVLDEADRMLDMGFRPVVDRIVAQIPRDRQTLFFSATLDGEAGRVADEYTSNAARHEHEAAPERRGDIAHRFVAVAHEAKLDELVTLLRSRGVERTLVFVRTKRGADRVAKRLGHRGVEAAAMHGDKSQGQRERALAAFENGRCAVLVATDVAARGLDVDGITHVVNFDAPEDRESYVHRAGRTGRAGRSGESVTFVMEDQARDIGQLAGQLSLHREFDAAGLRGGDPTHRHGGDQGHRHTPRPAGRSSRRRRTRRG